VGLLDRFEGRIFSAQDVTNGKPAPDIFLHTAAQMGASPQRCLVVEDTTIGVQAGRAAGMTVLGFARFTPADALTAAGAIPFIEMRRLPEIIRSL
jgi:beta-phosphoglucomutase-like phosphatase (HAD superfamily)